MDEICDLSLACDDEVELASVIQEWRPAKASKAKNITPREFRDEIMQRGQAVTMQNGSRRPEKLDETADRSVLRRTAVVKKRADSQVEVQEPKEEVSPAKKERPPEQRGVDKIIVDCKGLKLLFINDRDNNFLPIVSLNSSPFRILSCWNHEKSLI